MKKIFFISLVLMLLLSLFASAEFEQECEGELCIQEMRTATFFEQIFGRPFGIVTDKSTYKIGEVVTIDDTQYINAQCTDGIDVEVRVRRPDGFSIKSIQKKYPAGGWQAAFIRTSFDTTGSEKGEYEIETRWYCVIKNTRNELGEDGYIDNEKTPSTLKIKLVSPITILPPRQKCSKQCPAGYELINPDSKECFCEKTWRSNDGSCDLGEPVTSKDCEERIAPDDPNKPPSDKIVFSETNLILLVIGILSVFIIWFGFLKRK